MSMNSIFSGLFIALKIARARESQVFAMPEPRLKMPCADLFCARWMVIWAASLT